MRLNNFLGFGICVCAYLLSTTELAFAANSCNEPDFLRPQFSLMLKSTYLDNRDIFIGKFELKNNDVEPGIIIMGRRDGDDFFLDYPDIAIEFRDLNRKWVRLNHLPGSFLSSPDRLKLKPNSSAEIKVELFPENLVKLDGSDFRLLIEAITPSLCVVSYPFRAFPIRNPVKYFESIQTPILRSQ